MAVQLNQNELENCDLVLMLCKNLLTGKRSEVQEIDQDSLFSFCQFHSLTSIVCMALEDSGITPSKDFLQAKNMVIRRMIMQNAERAAISQCLTEQKIWHMFMKGVVLQPLYGRIGMRQMSDNDILFDKTYHDNVSKIMQERGYHLIEGNDVHADEWGREPFYSFEMHLMLIAPSRQVMHQYFDNIRPRLLEDAENPYLLHFTDEDYYLYMNAHAYKHFSGGGTGLRTVLDYFVYLREKQDTMNWDYLHSELEKLGIAEFEQQMRETMQDVFLRDSISEKSLDSLHYMVSSGTYGTKKNLVENRAKTLQATSRGGYILRKIFPPMSYYKKFFPRAAKYPILIPFVWIYRLFRGLFTRRDILHDEMKDMNNYFDKKEAKK